MESGEAHGITLVIALIEQVPVVIAIVLGKGYDGDNSARILLVGDLRWLFTQV